MKYLIVDNTSIEMADEIASDLAMGGAIVQQGEDQDYYELSKVHSFSIAEVEMLLNPYEGE